MAINMLLMKASLLAQIKLRRLQLGLRQQDMHMRVGVSRQQYQRIETQGNPRLDTLELIAQGLDSTLMLIPRDKQQAVLELLDEPQTNAEPTSDNRPSLVDDPWQGLLND